MNEQDIIKIAEVAVKTYAESHPRPPHVTQTQAAKMLGVSRPTLSRLVKGGVIKLDRCGLIPIGQIDKAIAARESRKSA